MKEFPTLQYSATPSVHAVEDEDEFEDDLKPSAQNPKGERIPYF